MHGGVLKYVVHLVKNVSWQHCPRQEPPPEALPGNSFCQYRTQAEHQFLETQHTAPQNTTPQHMCYVMQSLHAATVARGLLTLRQLSLSRATATSWPQIQCWAGISPHSALQQAAQPLLVL
jgi:hypothetical protein